MKLYVDREGDAPSPRRVRIYLAEKGIDVPMEKLAIHEENRTPEFREKNPVGTLPVLELDDGTCLSESIAICRYFEALHPEPCLFGRTPLEQARVEMWTRRVELYLYIPVDFTGHFERTAPEAAKETRSWGELAIGFLDWRLADRRFLVGDDYTIADAFALSALDFGMRFNDFAIADGQEHLARWHAEVSARPSARA